MTEERLIDFAEATRRGGWETVNDGVMGGLSQGEFVLSPDATALFRGHVSLANSGGFASVRTRPGRFDLRRFQGLVLRLRGDGRRYKLQLRTDDDFDGIAYQAPLPTEAGRWQTLRVPFAEFVPTFRGRVLRLVPPLDPGGIRRVGLLISEKQEGPFALEIAWIGGYAEAPAPDGSETAEGPPA